jgi:hypothetical protein
MKPIVMESSLARLSSDSSRIFLLLLENLEPKKSAGLTVSTEKKSGLKSLIFQKQKNISLRFNKNHFSCKINNQLRSFSCSEVSNGDLTFFKFLKKIWPGLKSLIFRILRLEKLDF